jgi:iron(II)-dependent oxidoreductase
VELTAQVARELDDARARSLALLAPLSDDDLVRQHSPLMSPLVWDLAHVGNYEDQWLVRSLGAPGLGERYDDIYDAFRHPRRTRSALSLLGPQAARDYIGAVRGRALDRLHEVDLAPDAADPLLRHGFVYGMVVQHEHQHDETMLATLQLMASPVELGPSRRSARPAVDEEVLVPGGPFLMGTDDDPWAYDNERPAHVVDVPAFWMDSTPVTNATYAAFVDAGGYDDPRWWAPDGWKWRQEAEVAHPQFWQRDGGWWLRRRFAVVEPLPADEPVQHVCWYEADACARWLGKRLPTEAEWEKAAREPGADLRMVGAVWEWTSSDFAAYPAFGAFPYREYSEVFFGSEYKVLRGGSWATHPSVARPTFRNWDYPIRRQIFAGFRCARDC